MSKHDHNIATRFNIFRKTYVAKSMVDAAKKLGCSHSKISDIETGKRAVDFGMITTLANEYNLNANWLATGRGPLRTDKLTGEAISSWHEDFEFTERDVKIPTGTKVVTLTQEETDMISAFSNRFDNAPEAGNDMDHLIKMNKMMQEVLQIVVTGVKQLKETVNTLSERVKTLEKEKVK